MYQLLKLIQEKHLNQKASNNKFIHFKRLF